MSLQPILFNLLSISVISTATLFGENSLNAQNQQYPGYLGVNVQEDVDGMEIISFIPRTPAARLARQGEISEGDIIVKLAGRQTRTLQELREARSKIPVGSEGKMVLIDGSGNYFFVWIGRNAGGNAGSSSANADGVRRGGRGDGQNEPDIRSSRGAASPDGENPDVRPKPR